MPLRWRTGVAARRRHCRGRVRVQHLQRLVRRRQVGGMGQPDQHHFGGADRPVDACTSGMPFSSICQARDSTRIDSASANSAPRVRSSSVSDASLGGRRHEAQPGDEMGEIGKVGQHHRRVGAGVVLRAELGERGGDVAPIDCSNRSTMRARSARPSMARTASAVDHAAAMGDRLVEQRQRIARRAFGGARDHRQRLVLGLDRLPARRSCADAADQRPASMRRRSKRWQRDSTVIGTLRISVVAKMNFTCCGGSSSVFSRPLKACVDSMCTSSMM